MQALAWALGAVLGVARRVGREHLGVEEKEALAEAEWLLKFEEGSRARARGWLREWGALNEKRQRRKKKTKALQEPYGFVWTGDRLGSYSVREDDYTRAVGRSIVGWVNEGWSYRDVQTHLLRLGVRTRGGEEWSYLQVVRANFAERRLQELEREATVPAGKN